MGCWTLGACFLCCAAEVPCSLVSIGDCSRDPLDSRIWRCSYCFYKMGQYLHITYIHYPVHFKSSLSDVLYLIQLNTMAISVMLPHLENKTRKKPLYVLHRCTSPNIFSWQFVEYFGTEGQLVSQPSGQPCMIKPPFVHTGKHAVTC